ncbi:MAG TPA: CDP-archaeol synthase [Dehalococcoidia bacterium]|nr:CDP-archaeol synthase [Dehalococcoidia bacterium]
MRATILSRLRTAGTGRADGLLARSLSAAVGVPVILGLVHLGGTPYSLGVALVLGAGTLELLGALYGAGRGPLRLVGQPAPTYLALAQMGLMVAAAHHGAEWWTGALALSLGLSFLWALGQRAPAKSLPLWLPLVAALAYLGLLGGHLVLLRRLPAGEDWALLAIFGAFSTDTAAYLVGRTIGRRRLAPQLSPGKTWEGTLGGLLLGSLGVALINWATGLRLPPAEMAALAPLVAVAATLGDLCESFLKRGTGIKDASAAIPGHGGFLDRLDSVLFVAPLVYYWGLWVSM